jgi:hypothetical protein
MKRSFCQKAFSAVAVLLTCCPVPAATTWTQPTQEELKMTADPKAPDAPAEYLFLEIWSGGGPFTVYGRIKIFTEKGREEFSDIRLDYVKGGGDFGAVEARTIHPDGTVVPFTGKPYDKELASFGGYSEMQRVFSMPDVQVGSILEFHCQISSLYGGGWYIQQPIFVRHGSFHFFGRSDLPMHTTMILPPGAKVTGTPMGGYQLTLDDIPPLPDEEYSPPMHSLGYRVQFLYTTYTSAADFWKGEGKTWSGNVNDVTYPSGKLKDAVDQMVAPGDSDEQKLRKIYDAVMKLENTDFTRARTKAENRAEKVKIKTANDIWTAQRGDGSDLTLLFVTMARAAKMKAYVMFVTDRSEDIFLRDVPSWSQLDDLIAIVEVDGKEQFFDPGERYCEFGKLKWNHAGTGGVRQTSFSGAQLATTPSKTYTDTEITRHAVLQLDADGTLHGTITILMTGDEALRWRQKALKSDEDETKKEFDEWLREGVAQGTHVKIVGFAALTDYSQPLVATVEVAGTLGTKTGHRLFLPGTFFDAQSSAPFAAQTRQTPIYMHYPYLVEDQFKLALAQNMSVEGAPPDAQLPFMPNADFVAKYHGTGTIYQYARRIRVANILYDPKDYSALRDFFQKVSSQDQQQVVVNLTSAAGTAGGSSGQ